MFLANFKTWTFIIVILTLSLSFTCFNPASYFKGYIFQKKVKGPKIEYESVQSVPKLKKMCD